MRRRDIPRTRPDEGVVLILVLVVVVVLGMVVVALADYASTSLRYGQVVESKNDRYAAADGAMSEAIERLRLPNGNSECLTISGSGTAMTNFPIPINGATSSVTCQMAGSGTNAVGQWALILTGNGIGSEKILSSGQAGGSGINPKEIGGATYMHDPNLPDDDSMALQSVVRVVHGDVYFPGDSCPSDGVRVNIDRQQGGNGSTRFEVVPPPRSGICVASSSIVNRSPKAEPPRSDLSGLPAGDADGDDTSFPGCRVFTPGVYTSVTLAKGPNYFKSGLYLFDNFTLDLSKDGNNIPVVTVGYPDTAAGLSLKIPNPGCQAAIVADAPTAGSLPGATIYLTRMARIEVNDGSIDFLPRHQGGFDWVSIHALPTSDLTAGTGAAPVLTTKQGSGKEATVQGWLWAPNAWVNFENVTGTDAKVQLAGGTAAARIHLGANATAGEFEVSVTTTPALSRFILTSTATKNGTTSITALVEYAPPNNVAVRSWRVVN